MSNVKLIRLHIVLCVAAMLALVASADAQSGEMIQVTIDTAGHVEDIPFDIDKPAAVSVQAFFPPTELGEIKFAVTDADGKAVSIASPKVLGPGAYSVAVSAAGVSSDSFSVKIGVSEPLDAYEPNDTREKASRIELPLRTVIKVDRGQGNFDWFKFSIDQAYVLSIHLRPKGSASVDFRVVDTEGKDVYKAASTSTSRGARYASLVAGEYYLVLSASGYSVDTEMELALFDPVGFGGDNGGFIAVGMKEGSVGLDQLTLIAKTSGKTLVETISPEIMKAELLEAVKEKPVETAKVGGSVAWILWVAIILILLAGAGTGYWMYKRPKEGACDPE